jgi:phenylalanyl-tRNA synthetase alpha chain
MTITTISPADLDRALSLRDLTDPAAGEHAVQHVVAAIEQAVATAWRIPVRREPGSRLVDVIDNYDRLRYRPDAVTRDARYTRYVGPASMLRSHTTAAIPGLLDQLTVGGPDEVLLSVPGICYRRDVIDRSHVGEPHQHDVWLIRRHGPPLTGADLHRLVGVVVEAVLPGRTWHTPPSLHPYTLAGREIYVRDEGRDVEVGECGLAHPEVLAAAGLPPDASGLAMGLGLDRLTMMAKSVTDIRLLRAEDPRIADQMHDLRPYRPVSAMPAVTRDLSLAVNADLDAELLGDRVRELLGEDASVVQEVSVRDETPYERLPETARRRIGAMPGHKNVLLRVVFSALDHTLTSTEANELRDRIYAGLHEGSAYEWAYGSPGGDGGRSAAPQAQRKPGRHAAAGW